MADPLKNALLIGYGNPDRQDDGVAWHVLAEINQRLGRPDPASPDEAFDHIGQSPDLTFLLQLTPDLAEDISQYQRVCFIDAHTGSVPVDVQAVQLKPEFLSSPFTHHLTPSSVVSLSQSLYGRAPEALLVSVRGYEFGFSPDLSALTHQLVEKAVDVIWAWL